MKTSTESAMLTKIVLVKEMVLAGVEKGTLFSSLRSRWPPERGWPNAQPWTGREMSFPVKCQAGVAAMQ